MQNYTHKSFKHLILASLLLVVNVVIISNAENADNNIGSIISGIIWIIYFIMVVRGVFFTYKMFQHHEKNSKKKIVALIGNTILGFPILLLVILIILTILGIDTWAWATEYVNG